MKVILETTRNMEEVCWCMYLAQSIVVNLNMAKCKVKEHTQHWNIHTKVSFLTISFMEKENAYGKMEALILVNFKMEKEKVLALLSITKAMK